RAFPVREAGGLIWVYLGPLEKEPPFPVLPFSDLPPSNRINVYLVEDCNFVQVMEGLIDSSHLSILHIGGLKETNQSDLDFAKKTSHMQFNAAPRIEAEETDFGFHYVALRDVPEAEGGHVEARVAAFLSPFFIFNPNADLFFALVPINDTRTKF